MPKSLQPYAASVLLIVLMMSIMAGGHTVTDVLRFDRTLIDQGEVWRLFTAHFVHLSWNHALGNSAGLLLANYIAGKSFQQSGMACFFVFSALFTGLCLWLFAGDLYRYVGLSGVLHGLLVWSMLRTPYYPSLIKALFVGVIIVKVIWEQTPFYNDLALQDIIGGRVEARAHLFGLLSVLVWWCFHFYFSRRGKA
ncbi:rhombosortase [Thalassolituus marinus]|uniref:Rhombosortase n=1 Tax=Thalassolituus marinus TaxID=671053 RepID=A0ABS7ZUU1_9GAMM|nr:rhombosortase [Thalassolituus marinus]MCA6064883.1 rhombosortase [Thalassolituus marinus]